MDELMLLTDGSVDTQSNIGYGGCRDDGIDLSKMIIVQRKIDASAIISCIRNFIE
jgi:hypothetical protein